MKENMMKDMEIVDRIEVAGVNYLVVKFRYDDKLWFGTLKAEAVGSDNRLIREVSLLELYHKNTRVEAIERRKQTVKEQLEIGENIKKLYEETTDPVAKKQLGELFKMYLEKDGKKNEF